MDIDRIQDKNMVMFKVNVFEVKAKLSEYLDRAARGERIVICRHNQPVAELRAVEEVRTEPRPVGPLPGRPAFDVPPSFFDPLPDEDLGMWEGVTGKRAGRRPARRRRRSSFSIRARFCGWLAEDARCRRRQPKSWAIRRTKCC
jgi:prevent-host-death family protein